MKKVLKFSFAFLFIVQSLFSQSVQGNWQAVSAIVEYTYVARDSSESPDDVNSALATTASWPSSANPAPGATFETASFNVGDTITTQLVPLVNPTLLAMLGVDMNVDFNDEGTFTINDGSTYPTTEEQNCSTYAVVPAVAENGTWTSAPGFDLPGDPNTHIMGWGISLSSVFAQFNPADLTGEYGVDFGPGTAMPNWGQIEIGYTDETHTTPTTLETYWEATDGAASGLGVDDDGVLNSFLGIPIAPADTVTLTNTELYLAYVHPDTNLWYDLGWTGGGDGPLAFPMLGGSGQTVDLDNPDTYETDPITGQTYPAGLVDANRGYYFDPAGGDGIPFNGDEPFAATGYFLTYNMYEAGGTFLQVFEGVLAATSDAQAALRAGVDSVATIYVDDAVADPIADNISAALYAEFVDCLGNTGGDQELCEGIFEKAPTATLLAIKDACAGECGVDDSGHDWSPDSGVGRLVLEVDNVCVRDITTQTVLVNWVNTQFVEVDEDAPISSEFKLHGNYPNPFNPSTKIKFSTEMLSNVTLNVYSLIGEKVYTADQGMMNAGTYDISWYGVDNAGNKVSSGVYFYEIQSNDRIAKGKMLLMK